MDLWANTSLSELGEHAEYIDSGNSTTTTLGAGIGASISLGSAGGYLGVWRVEIDDEAIYPITTERLYRDNREWQTQRGEPQFYYMDSMATISTNDSINMGVWPLSSGGYKLRVISTVTADVLETASATDKVMLPLWAVPGLVWGILSNFYDSESRMQNPQVSAFYRRLFEDVMTRLKVRSFSRMKFSKAWGEGPARRSIWDASRLFPEDGVPVP
jgi:hypothetical protein